jgi:uncharacterized protein YqjF (DUF2071 family)
VPALSTFPELNVRTYVTVDGKPGIWFLSLDASSRLAVEAARRTYKLPYFQARMSVERRDEDIAYSCRRETDPKRSFEAGYRPTGDTFNATPGSLEWFLTERYCLYAIDRGALHRAEIQHPPWELQLPKRRSRRTRCLLRRSRSRASPCAISHAGRTF